MQSLLKLPIESKPNIVDKFLFTGKIVKKTYQTS